MDSLNFLERLPRGTPQPIYVAAGDDDFLKRQVRKALKRFVLGEDADEFGLSTHPGDKADFAAVRDELDTLPFLTSRRLVLVENADPFVTRCRPMLEKYIGQPSASGVLVLEVKSWPGNTRLAKMVPDQATVKCEAPAGQRLSAWCVKWAAATHGKQLTAPAAQLLIELVGAELGQLDQELAKLAAYVGDAARIDVQDVDVLVGRSQAANTFKIFDAIGEGRPGQALEILDRLFEQGEDPMRILGAFSMQLRRLAQAARLTQQGVPVGAALQRAGMLPFAVKGGEQQLRHLGRRRADRLYDWLLETDLGMKGSSALPPRALLERLIVRLGRPRENEPRA